MSNNKNNTHTAPAEWKAAVVSPTTCISLPSTKFTASNTIVNNSNEDTNNFTKTGDSGWSNGEVTSKQSFVGDGFVIAKIATIDSAIMFGLTASPDTDNAGSLYKDIDYGAYFRLGKMNEIYESGTRFKLDNAGSDTTAVTYSAGDSAKVARIGTEIKYYHIDGETGVETLLKTTTGVSADTELYFDAAFYYKGDTLEEVALHKTVAETTENEFTPPSVAIYMDDTELTAGEQTTVTFVFSEAPAEEKSVGVINPAKPSLQNDWKDFIIGDKTSFITTTGLSRFFYDPIESKINSFGLDDIIADNGTLSNLQVDSANPKVYTALFTPVADITDDTNVIRVGIDWIGVSGNVPTAVAYSDNYAINSSNSNNILAKIYEDSTGNEDGILVTAAELSEVATGVNIYLESRYQNAIQAETNFSNPNKNAAEMTEEVQALINTQSANLSFLYQGKTIFNDDISDMNTSLATNMGYLFYKSNFNQDIGSWDVSNATNIGSMFYGATAFNQDIGDWDVSSVNNIKGMFYNATVFNQDISGWDVGNAVDMGYLFRNTNTFNQDIGSWDVSNAVYMAHMFQGSRAFNQDIGNWNIASLINASNFLDNSVYTTANFDKLLAGWSDVNTRQDESIHMGVVFDAKGIQYTNATAHTYMTDVHNWIMTDGGLKQDSNDNGVNDVFVSGKGADILEYGSHKEAITLHGLGGDDRLTGSAFNDRIYGGAGNDTLVGNTGADTFVYSYKNAGHDIIADFSTKQGDKLDLKYLLDGYNGRDISNYITAISNAEGDSVLNIRANGNEEGSVNVQITLIGISASDITSTWIDDNLIVL